MRLLDVFKFKKSETIVSAGALKYEGKIYLGHMHSDAYEKLVTEKPDADLSKAQTGFLTSEGRFITDRQEATRIAERARQLTPKRLQAIKEYEHGELHSEDLHS